MNVAAFGERGATRRAVLRAAGSAGAVAGAAGLGACGVGGASPPAKRERSATYSVRFMALANSSPWQPQQVEVFNKDVGPANKLQVSFEPQPDQATLFSKFQSTVAAG